MEKNVCIHTEFITLGQFVKLEDLTSTGGEEKAFVSSHQISVNGEAENRRGKKLRPGDKVVIDDVEYLICTSQK